MILLTEAVLYQNEKFELKNAERVVSVSNRNQRERLKFKFIFNLV